MTNPLLRETMKNMWWVLALILPPAPGVVSARDQPAGRTLQVTTYDGLSLPARVLEPAKPSDRIIVVVNGSTPYDENSNQATIWTDRGEPFLEPVDFYQRFAEVMPLKGYAVATAAKRSFVHPEKRPRPSLDDLALDVVALIEALKAESVLAPDKQLVLVGYSEGSIVATKVVGLLKQQPSALILLGSASNAFDYRVQTWEEWYRNDVFRRTKGWTDEQIKQEFTEFASVMRDILDLDEATWENEYKKSRPFGFGFAPWESLHIDQEVLFYDPVPNVLTANIPTLICIGENDTAMPRVLAERTYRQLVEQGFNKATFRVIPDEVHQYRKYDVFAIIDRWLASDGQSTDFTLTALDRQIIETQAQRDRLRKAIDGLPYSDAAAAVLGCFNEARESQMSDPRLWSGLGIRLFGIGAYDEAFHAFKESDRPGNVARYAARTWMGHIQDLRGKRQEAVRYYEEALDLYPGFAVQHDQWNMVLDEDWIRERLTTVFVFDRK